MTEHRKSRYLNMYALAVAVVGSMNTLLFKNTQGLWLLDSKSINRQPEVHPGWADFPPNMKNYFTQNYIHRTF